MCSVLCGPCTTSPELQVAWLMQVDWKAAFVRGNSDPNRLARVATFFRSNKQSPNFMGESSPTPCLCGRWVCFAQCRSRPLACPWEAGQLLHKLSLPRFDAVHPRSALLQLACACLCLSKPPPWAGQSDPALPVLHSFNAPSADCQSALPCSAPKRWLCPAVPADGGPPRRAIWVAGDLHAQLLRLPGCCCA